MQASRQSRNAPKAARNRNGTMTHRFFLAMAALLGCCAVAFGQAADYPTRQITIIVAVAAGSQADQFARLMAEPLQQKLGKPVVVENRPGGGQVTGVNAAAKAAPDGYTLMHGNLSGFIISPQLRNPPPYNTPRDFAPIALTLLRPPRDWISASTVRVTWLNSTCSRMNVPEARIMIVSPKRTLHVSSGM